MITRYANSESNHGWASVARRFAQQTSQLLIAFLVVAVAAGNIGKAAEPLEYKGATINWQGGGCGPSSLPSGVAGCIIAKNNFCVQYSGLTQATPDTYYLGATVWSSCNPESGVRSGSNYTATAVPIGAVPSCTTMYGSPDAFYNAPGYVLEPSPTSPYKVAYRCRIRVIEIDQSRKPADLCVNNPIQPGTGNKRQIELDYLGSGALPLTFERIYNSSSQYAPNYWTHNHLKYIKYAHAALPRATVYRGRDAYTFVYTASEWVPDADVNLALSGTSTMQILSEDRTEREYYNSSGNITEVRNAGSGALKYSYVYSTSTTPLTVAPGVDYLISVRNAYGQSLQFTYDTNGRIVTMRDAGGGLYQYAYHATGTLASVTYPDLSVKQYIYNEPSLTAGASRPNALTGIVDESNVRYASFGYSALGQAVLSEHAGGVQRHTINYGAAPVLSEVITFDVSFNVKYVTRTLTAPTGVTVTDAHGTSRSYSFTSNNGNVRTTGSSQVGTAFCSAVPLSRTLDAKGNPDTALDFNGVMTDYTYDQTRNLETSRIEAIGTPRARAVTTTWHPTYRLPASIAEPGRTTTFTYSNTGYLRTKTITDTTSNPAAPRTWTYMYSGTGQLLTEDGPRTDVSDVTTSVYYNCTTGVQCGQLQSDTNAQGQTTTYDLYDAHGMPLKVTDPNGVVSTFAYDARQRMTARCVNGLLPACAGGETTTMEYYPTGLLKKVVMPGGEFVSYIYDAAHRLTEMVDGAGNRIVYSLDNMNNRIGESVYDPSNALRRTHTRVFNALNQLYGDVNAAGTAGVSTLYGYDANGNQTSVAAPLGRSTAHIYDELNRLQQTTDTAGGTTQFAYDGNHNLTGVTDPKGLTTQYTYNGLGDLKAQLSPDTGLTINTYDSAGNLKTSTDARNAVATYTYDALNRVTSVAYRNGTVTDQTINYVYDTGANGKGKLVSASDANHATSWSYDAQGRVIGRGQTVGTVTHSVGYGYANGRLVSQTLPSGGVINYAYDSNGQVASVSLGSTVILNNVTHDPFGPVKGWTWGNGQTHTRSFDLDGRVQSLASSFASGINQSYTYDDASRITAISDTATDPNSWVLSYDPLDRLSTAAGPTQTQGWTYDANGNRMTETGTQATTYAVSASSNRLTGTAGFTARAYSYDAVGNARTYEDVTLTYNNRNRLASTQKGATTRSYVYNALGQMIRATGGAADTVIYVYDEAGHLLGEYTASGARIQETVWLGDIPIATLRGAAAPTVYYVHADHLNTPTRVTRTTDNARQWQWSKDPFGTLAANSNPEGLGDFAYNLRFPGQIFDAQAGLHQNYFRDYSPAVGRYVESDPVGLRAGLNTYTYVWSSPAQLIDPLGLQGTTVDAYCARYGSVACAEAMSGGQAVRAVPPALGTGIAAVLWCKLVGCSMANETSTSEQSKPKDCPAGTLDIKKAKKPFGLDHDDVETIKDGVGASPSTWTGVAPNGDIWVGTPDGRGRREGNIRDFQRGNK